jgi:glycine cleavage system regulatory protein
MQTTLVMTVIGRDRTGLVETLARFVAGHDGNWLESRMCRLGGEFAGLVRVSVPAEQQASLTAALEGLQAQGLAIVVKADAEGPGPVPLDLLHLDLVGHDRPGIVREITAALTAQGVNVEELATEVISAPMSGESLFQAHATLALPPDCDPAALRRELEQIAANLMVDLSLDEPKG